MSTTSHDQELGTLLGSILSSNGKTIDSNQELFQKRTSIETFQTAIDDMNRGHDRLDRQLTDVKIAKAKLESIEKSLTTQMDHLHRARNGLRSAIRGLEDSNGL